jgi:hypothetical protein
VTRGAARIPLSFDEEIAMKKTVFLLALAAGAASATAQQSLKPGLWEIQHRMSGNPGLEKQMEEARKQMAALPPEQRKQMEAMMASSGVQMGPGGNSMRMCMTKEMAERNEVPANQGDCKVTNQSRSGNTMKMAFTCTNPPSSGESQVTFTSPEAYAMKTTVNTTAGGKPEKMTMEGNGKWLGADCGSVKPMAPPAKK